MASFPYLRRITQPSGTPEGSRTFRDGLAAAAAPLHAAARITKRALSELATPRGYRVVQSTPEAVTGPSNPVAAPALIVPTRRSA